MRYGSVQNAKIHLFLLREPYFFGKRAIGDFRGGDMQIYNLNLSVSLRQNRENIGSSH